MKEMTNIHTTHQGGSVKKTLFVVALAAMLVFAFAGSPSPVQPLRPAAPRRRTRAEWYVPPLGADTNIYMNWATASPLGTNGRRQLAARQLHDDDRQVRRVPRGPLCRSR